MNVYIEYVLFENMIINFLILYLLNLTTKSKVKKINLIIACIIGAVFAVILPKLYLTNLSENVVKLIFGFILILILRKYKTFSEFFLNYIIFLMYTFVLGGLCFGVLCALNQDNANSIDINSCKRPVGVIISIIIFFSIFLIRAIKYFTYKSNFSNYFYNLEINTANRKINLIAYLDTGNIIYDNVENMGVSVISFKSFLKIFKNFPLHKILMKDFKNTSLTNAHFINVKTINSADKMLVFELNNVKIKSKNFELINQKMLFGVSKQNFANYDCLLNMSCIE